MRRLFPVCGVLLLVGCASDAEREATLRAYEESAPAVASCDKAAASRVLLMMSAPEMSRANTTPSGLVVVHFGSDYSAWTPAQLEAMVTNFANADACIQGRARRIEFQSPAGTVIANADELRGIRMSQ